MTCSDGVHSLTGVGTCKPCWGRRWGRRGLGPVGDPCDWRAGSAEGAPAVGRSGANERRGVAAAMARRLLVERRRSASGPGGASWRKVRLPRAISGFNAVMQKEK